MEITLESSETTFIYRDAKGNITVRTVSNVSETEDYLQGICLRAGDLRTFRRDRILGRFPEEASAEGQLSHHIAKNLPPKPSPRSHNLIDICFTGFKSNDKERLIGLAESVGMAVRDCVTKNLNFLCGGSNAGPSKIEKARKQGVVFLSEKQFIQLLETGEMPEG